MALKVQSSFSAGELDPALHERTTLAKYKAGLKTARNVMISKTGSVMSRPGRKYFVATKNPGERVKGYCPPDSGYFIEWGNLYARIYTFTDEGEPTVAFNVVHALTTADLDSIHFETSGKYVYAFRLGKVPLKLDYTAGTFVGTTLFDIPTAPTNATNTPGAAGAAPTGYDVDYAITYVKSGQESNYVEITSGTAKIPIAAGTFNTIDARVATTLDATITEMRVYRRPRGGGAYGFIGTTTAFTNPSATNKHGSFTDIGQSADYTNSPPATVIADQTAPKDLHSKTGCVYQQRLVMTDGVTDLEAIFASRPGFQNNFYRDYPLNSDSALKFKAGTSGYAKVRRMIDADGLVAFTSNGIFLHSGALTPENLAMSKKGKWKIKEDVPPLALPGGVFMVDEATNTIRNLVWSQDLAGFNGEEVSIFSNHLFREKQVRSWAFQEGMFPLLWVGFDDGTYASFTYEFDQEMRAWTRHDGENFKVEEIVGTGSADQTIFLMSSHQPGSSSSSVRRHWEITVPRQVRAVDLENDPEAVMGVSMAAMDHMFTWKEMLADDLIDDGLLLDPVTVSDENDGMIDGTARLYCTDDAIFTDPGNGEVGTIFRWFDPTDQTFIDLEVVSRTSDNEVVVSFSAPFPTIVPGTTSDSNLSTATGLRLYKTVDQIDVSGFSFGTRELSLIVDGVVVRAPNNDIEAYGSWTPADGGILPNGLRGAIIHVGYPFTADVETLDVDTVEQAPTLVESITCNKIDIKVHNSRGLYIGHEFPDDDLVSPMQDIDSLLDDEDTTLTPDTYKHPETKRVEMTLPGDWQSQGRVALRQVDPLHFEILSLIPDLEIHRRSDR